jgi:hypothetical protein
VAIALAGLVAAFVMHQHSASEAAQPAAVVAARAAMTAEQQAYLSSITFSDFHMSAANNFLGNTVTYLDGTITNQGAKPVRTLDVDLVFVDTLNQIVLKETVHPLADRTSPLAPGQSFGFRATFEHIPVDWNQAAPEAKAVYVGF